jgi:hypothetical protein
MTAWTLPPAGVPGVDLLALDAGGLPGAAVGGEDLAVQATFPETMATHAREQVFYYNAAGLLRRHDYAAEVLGGAPAAHFCEKHVTASGLVFPTHRYVVPNR